MARRAASGWLHSFTRAPGGAMTFSHQTVDLSRGRHRDPDDGVCVMELASMLAGQRFTDRPATVSPLLCLVLQGYNDGLEHERRQTLKRFAATCLETAG